jgi:hypothetical protein
MTDARPRGRAPVGRLNVSESVDISWRWFGLFMLAYVLFLLVGAELHVRPQTREQTATLACNQQGYPHGEIDDQWRIVCWHDAQKTVLGAK